MSLLDVKKNVDSRAAALLEYHLSLLGTDFGSFDSGTMAYVREDAKTGSAVSICYGEKNKFMSKTYDLIFKIRIPEVNLGDSFKARLKFRGMKQIDAGFFEIKPDHEVAHALLNDTELMDEIVTCSRQADIAVMTVVYSEGAEALTVQITPYAGAFMWVKLPPVYYPLKLKPEEMKALYALTGDVEKYLIRRIEAM
ncbi:MAG: hypothetical protein LBT52_00355 [Clostridiales Family XIII bacterium]|jgi:hypothetical protein|nr:hypothetical protein [Clostridiales Family XIII bacterium]